MKSGIYCIRNLINGKVYIGSSLNVHESIKHHFRLLKRNKHVNSHLQFAYNKYRDKNFESFIIEIIELNSLIAREQYWMDYYQSYKIGYNIKPRADHTIHSKETKDKIGKSNKGKHFNNKGNKNPFYGKKHSLETRKILSEKTKERFKDPKNNPMYGVQLFGKLNGTFGKKKSKESLKRGVGTRRKNGTYFQSKETRAKRSIKLMGNKNAKGKNA